MKPINYNPAPTDSSLTIVGTYFSYELWHISHDFSSWLRHRCMFHIFQHMTPIYPVQWSTDSISLQPLQYRNLHCNATLYFPPHNACCPWKQFSDSYFCADPRRQGETTLRTWHSTRRAREVQDDFRQVRKKTNIVESRALIFLLLRFWR